MAIDFPNSPTTGQIFTAANGTSWQWNGTVWVAAGTATGLITGAPNKLINPFMEIDQANEGVAVTSTSSYVVDGWVPSIIGTFSAQRVTDAPAGYPNSIRATITASHTVAAGDVGTLQYRIEAEELADTRIGTSSAQTLSLAFWIKSSVAGTYGASLRNAAGNRSYYFPVVITAANTWQFVSEVIPGDTAGTWVTSGNALGAYLDISLYMGSTFQGTTPHTWVSGNLLAPNTISNTIATTVNATFQLGPCGLWVAPAAQPLLRTSFQEELARCQRYYEKSYDLGVTPGSGSNFGYAAIAGPSVAAGGNGIGKSELFSTPKRADATITLYSSTGASGKVRDQNNNVDLNGIVNWAGQRAFLWLGATGASATSYVLCHWTADARL